MTPRSFLSPLAGGQGQRSHLLRNLRTGLIVASHLEGAFDSAARRHGLLGRPSLPLGTGLVLAPCFAVHTCFMRFPIDVVFVTRGGGVTRICRSLSSWRFAGAFGAFAVIELAAGALALSDTQVLDSLAVELRQDTDRLHAAEEEPSRDRGLAAVANREQTARRRAGIVV